MKGWALRLVNRVDMESLVRKNEYLLIAAAPNRGRFGTLSLSLWRPLDNSGRNL